MAILGIFGKKKVRKLACRDAGMDCNEVITGKNDDEVMQKAGEHAKKAHNMTATPEMAAKLKTLIKDG